MRIRESKPMSWMLVLGLAILTLSAPLHAQGDQGTPDSICVGQVIVPGPPWPAFVEVPITIWSDETVAGLQLGFKPEYSDGSTCTDIIIESFAHDNSVFNVPGAFWTPTPINASLNAILFGWTAFDPSSWVDDPQGEIGVLRYSIDNPNIPTGTELVIDSTFVPPTGFFIYTVSMENLTYEVDPAPYRKKTWNIRFGEVVGICGDFDGNSSADIGDVVYLVNYIFAGGAAPVDPSGGDINCDGSTNITDAVYLVWYLFGSGAEPCAGCR